MRLGLVFNFAVMYRGHRDRLLVEGSGRGVGVLREVGGGFVS